MKRMLLMAAFLIAFAGCAIADDIEGIRWLTEQYKYASYRGEKGEATGWTVDILLEAWKILGLKKKREDIEFVPWARGMAMLEKDKRYCLFGTSITEERKKKFVFAGKLPGTTSCLIAKKEKQLKFNSIEEVNQAVKEGSVGSVKDDITRNTFLKMGGNSKLLYTFSHMPQLYQTLEVDRVDLIATGDLSFFKHLKDKGKNPDNYEIVFKMARYHWGYAFNKNVSPKIVERLDTAIKKIPDDRINHIIFQKYYGIRPD